MKQKRREEKRGRVCSWLAGRQAGKGEREEGFLSRQANTQTNTVKHTVILTALD